MGTVSRHAGVPFIDGEVLNGADLETDVSNIFAEVNGSLDNTNLSGSAGILGGQLADDTITTAKMNASAVPKSYVDSVATSANIDQTDWTIIPGITAATLTPGSSDDIVMCNFQSPLTEGSLSHVKQFGFSVNGTDSPALQFLPQTGAGFDRTVVSIMYAVAAGTTDAISIYPQYKTGNAADDWTFPASTRLFRCFIMPEK